MLTKEHLSYGVRLGVVKPKFLDPQSENLQIFLTDLIEVFRTSIGHNQAQILETCEDMGHAEDFLFSAFYKIILDQCDFSIEENLKQIRWQYFKEAQDLRLEKPFSTLNEFQEALSHRLQEPFSEISHRIYGDLPESQKLKKTIDETPEYFIHTYNLFQVQGLLIKSKSLKLKFSESSLGVRRSLIRNLKFHRLLFESLDSQTPGVVELDISGPLTMMDKGQTYGLQLANFFPHILALSCWEISADVVLGSKICQLKLSQKDGLKNQNPKLSAYVPEDYRLLLDSWKMLESDWQIQLCEEVYPLGYHSDCWPDFVFQKQTGEKVYLELFHRWHFHQIPRRFKALEKKPIKNLIVGVCKSINAKDRLEESLESTNTFKTNGFLFKDFPTAKMIFRVLKSLDPLC